MAAISILTCLLSYREVGSIPVKDGSMAFVVGSLAGGVNGSYFPVIPYSLYLVAGIYFARKQIGFQKLFMAIACAGTLWHTIDYVWISGQQPSRFPLSVSYLIGAALYVYLYYLLAIALERRESALPVRYLVAVGKNSLFYLLFSNLIIFAVTATKFYKKQMNYSVGLFVVILLVIWYLQGLCRGKTLRQGKN